MSVVKHNTYFKENDGKVYYYDSEGIKKELPSTAFSNLQEQIDNLGSPLTYSGAQSVDELNELVDIKTGTVYTVTGNSGTLTAGGIDVQPSTEVAWAGEWFNIGKDLDNSWKQWSEGKGSEGDSNSVYIGNRNSAYQGGYSIGTMNESLGYVTEIIIPPETDTIEFKDKDDNTATLKLGFRMVPAPGGAGIAATAINMCYLPEIYGPSFQNYDYNDFNNNSAVVNIDDEPGASIYQNFLTNGYWTTSYYGTPLTYNTIIPCTKEEVLRIATEQSELISECKIEQMGIPSMSIGQSNSALQAGYSIGTGNSADSTTMSLGFNNSSYGESVALGVRNTAQYNSVAIGRGNKSQYGTHVLGENNIIEGTSNIVIGKENKTLNTNDSYILGKYNTMSGNYINNNTVIGNSNTASGTHNSFIIGEQNATVDQNGVGYSYVIGQNNAAGDCSLTLGTANSSQSGSMYKATLGWENKVGNSNNVVIGGNNSANENVGNNTIIAGYDNESSGGNAFGNFNKVNAESYAYGQSNSAMDGSITFGKNNSGNKGSYAIGDGSKVNYGGYSLGTNSALNGSHILGRGNFAANGGGMFGYNNLGGKGGYIVGDKNWIYYYDSTTSSYSAEKVEEFIDENGNFINGYKMPAQYAFGYQNNIYHGDGPALGYAGTYFQIGYNNSILSYYRDQDTGIYYGARLNNGPGAEYNIGRNNSAVNAGINLGASNIILTGDSSVGASINIGKNLVNRYGVLIGQSISSYGYGIGIGDYINGVNAGDTIIGTNIITDSGSNGKLSYRSTSRSIFGRYLQGYFTSDASVFGSYISAFSGTIPNRTNWYTYGIGSDALVIGSHIKGSVGAGSILIGQNASNDAAVNYNSQAIVPVVVTGDSMVFGGYTHDYNQSAYYRNPGISASYNGIILGQGQQMSATNDSIIVGNQSIAQYGSKVFGSHGYANNASMVLNPSPMTFQPQTITGFFLNGMLLTSAPEIYGSNTAFGLYKQTSNGYVVEKCDLSGTLNLEMPTNNNTCQAYFSYIHKSLSDNENGSFVALNIKKDNTLLDYTRGYWNDDRTIFTPDNNYNYNAGIIPWSKGALLLIKENGVKKIYEYNEETSSTVNFPKYFYIQYNAYYPYSFVALGNETNSRSNKITPNILNGNVVTDGEYIYYIPTNQWDFYSTRGFSIPNSLIPTSFSGSINLYASAAYFNTNDDIDLIYPSNITAYGYKGITGQIYSGTSSIYPSAIYSEVSSMITNTTADCGSIAIGYKNSAYNGSVAINTQSYYLDNYSYTAQHSIGYNLDNSSKIITNYKVNSSASITSQNDISLVSYNIEGFIKSADAFNKAGYGSVSIAVGGDDYDTFENKKEKYGNISYNGSMIIGLNSSAYNGSYIIGKSKYASEDSIAIGPNGSDRSTYKSVTIGFNNTANNNSMTVGFQNNVNTLGYFLGYKGGSIHDNGFGLGFNSQAYSMGWNIGYNSYAYYNGFSFGFNIYSYSMGWAVGYNSTAAYDAISIGFNQNVQNKAFAIGGNNYIQGGSYAIGYFNRLSGASYAFGYNNYSTNNSVLIGFDNADYVGNYTDTPSDKVNIFGRYNQIVGRSNYSTDTNTSVYYDVNMFGNNNTLVVDKNSDESYNFAGIMLGQSNHYYKRDLGPGGYNIYLGYNNKGSQEAINIGTDNDTMGHSIGLGWHNRAVKGGTEHAILIGNGNIAKNTQGYIYQKSYPYISQKILSDGEISNIQREITGLQEQITTAYQNSADKANEIYSLLIANGLDSVSANDYTNGNTYNSGWISPGYYQATPWNIESRSFEYEENGTWYTGHGESAYIKQLVYSYSSYSSYDTTSNYYKYCWLPTQQASAMWKTVSAIYTAQYGSDSANRYNAVNTAIQHINELSQSIYTKQYELTQNPITASGTTDSHNIETMSLVVGQGNSADHHNSIVIGSENHTLKMVNTYTTGDDGFTVAIGVGNTVARNYDMAIGYGSVAYGGENIAIGGYNNYVDYNWNYYNARTSAVGLRNISIRSTLTGFDNMAYISYIGGTGISSTINNGMAGIWDSTHTNFERNQLFDFVGNINGFAYAINNNKFDYVKLNLDVANTFDRNNLRVVLSSNISANTATENTYNNFKIVDMTAYLDNNNTYNNVTSSTLIFNGITNNNIFSNVDSAKLTQKNGYSLDHNLLYNINGRDGYWFDIFDFTANNDFNHNLIIQSNISGSNNNWPGVTNNLLYKSYLEIYNPSDKNENAINGYEGCFTENMLIGTEAYGQVQESFSFGALDSSKVYRTTDYGNLEAPVLRDDFRVFNFGDNRIQHSFDTFIAGSKNDLNGVNKFVVMGGGNAVSSNAAYEGSNIGSYSNFHDSVILGTNNLIATPNSAYNGYLNTQNYILGHANTIVVNSKSNDYNDSNSNLRIIGLDNHFANIPSYIINSTINGVSGGSIYSFTVYAQETSTSRDVSRYDSIIPVKASTGHGSTYYNSYSGYAISGASRNTIIGSHSVIASNITDSTTIGLYNTIYQNDQLHNEKFSDNNLIGSFNLGINGSHQFNVGFNNITSGHHSTAIGEELRANSFQTILGKYNTSAEGTTRTTMKWNSDTNTVEQVENTGVLLAVGNGRLNLYEKYVGMSNEYPVYNWYDENNNLVDEKYITTDNYIQRSNAMIVSADGTVSARRFIESEPALTITGGDYVSVTEDTTNNKLVIDLESSLGQMLQELSGVLTTKPSTGRHILGVDNGSLTWLEVNQ